MAPLIGWFEEAPGVKSSTRLFAAILLGCVIAVITYLGFYLFGRPNPNADVISSLAGVITALVAQGIVALMSRSHAHGEDPEEDHK